MEKDLEFCVNNFERQFLNSFDVEIHIPLFVLYTIFFIINFRRKNEKSPQKIIQQHLLSYVHLTSLIKLILYLDGIYLLKDKEDKLFFYKKTTFFIFKNIYYIFFDLSIISMIWKVYFNKY